MHGKGMMKRLNNFSTATWALLGIILLSLLCALCTTAWVMVADRDREIRALRKMNQPIQGKTNDPH